MATINVGSETYDVFITTSDSLGANVDGDYVHGRTVDELKAAIQRARRRSVAKVSVPFVLAGREGFRRTLYRGENRKEHKPMLTDVLTGEKTTEALYNAEVLPASMTDEQIAHANSLTANALSAEERARLARRAIDDYLKEIGLRRKGYSDKRTQEYTLADLRAEWKAKAEEESA